MPGPDQVNPESQVKSIDPTATSTLQSCLEAEKRIKEEIERVSSAKYALTGQVPENGDTSGCGGKRFNVGKPMWQLIPPSALLPSIRVMMLGLKKYGKGNWQKGMSWLTIYDCLIRHASAWREGEDIDPESGENHMAHVICNAMMLIWYALKGRGKDDRREEESNRNGIGSI
jgi:hypothetical protein